MYGATVRRFWREKKKKGGLVLGWVLFFYFHLKE